MHPILFSIGPIKIYSYGFMLAIGFLSAAYFISLRSRLFNIKGDIASNLVILLVFSGIIGARILYILLNLNYFINRPIEMLMLYKGGLVFYGGFIVAFFAGIIFIRLNRLPILDTADLIAPFIAMGHAIGRIGCFLNGCCYGKPTSCFLGVAFPGSETKIYPTQLFSATGLLIIFLILFYLQKKRRFKGQILFLYLVLYGGFRFFIEFLRGDLLPVFYNLTATQIISLGFVIVGAASWLRKKHVRRRGSSSYARTERIWKKRS